MADITKRLNEECKQKNTCYRYTSVASSWQSYSLFNVNNESKCQHYLHQPTRKD